MPCHVPQPPATILHVGGNTTHAFAAALRAAGFSVTQAATGGEVLRLAATHPDLVLLHLPLPDLAPAEVCRRLAADADTAPVVLCAGGAGGEEWADACLSAAARPEDGVALVKALLRARGFAKAMRDLTERKRAEDELRRLHADLEEKIRRKDEFLALLGHELRNPLAPIRTAVSLLELKGDDPAVVAEARQVIDRQATQMTRLVDELLDAGRIARGKVKLQCERLDLGMLVRSAAGDQRGNLEAAGLELAIETPADPVWVWGDGVRLTQVVGNLLDNALKSTAPGGRVAVRLAVRDAWAALSVEDTGIGIPAEVLPKLFEAFIQVDSAPERTRGGLGLGLSVVKGLMELHGGWVEAASGGLGQGSRFTAWLPLDTAPRTQASRQRQRPEVSQRVPPVADPSAERESHRSGSPLRRILIVEDNRDAAESLRMLLAAHGHEAAVAHTGPEGIEQARAFDPEVVICDLGLPGMSGFEVVRVLRAEPRTSGALLVCVSGYGQEEDLRKARAAGFDEALVKPVEPEVLLRLLARLRA
jgi:signal transduction histidine kinase